MTASTNFILYTSKRRTASLSDVKVSIYDSAGSAVVASAAMTEIANGDYSYSYTPTATGFFTWFANSATQDQPKSGYFESDYTSSTTAGTSATADLVTTQELCRFVNIEGVVPDRNATGSARARETVGTGDNSTTLFYLDQAYILADTYTIYSGASSSAASSLTEITHYTLDKDNGTITLTSAGVTQVGTDNIYAEYSYCTHKLTDTQLSDSLDRAQSEFENLTYSQWTDGTLATPNYTQITNEKHDGQGEFNRDYFLLNFPLPNFSTSLSSDIAVDATTVEVSSTNGFLSSGYVRIDSNKVKYTGKTTTAFTGTTGVDTAASSGATVEPNIFEISTTSSGSVTTWEVLEDESEFDLDYDAGRVHVYRTDIVLDQFTSKNPPRLIPNRFRATYIWGNDTVPNDVKRAVMMIAGKDLIHTAARRGALDGVRTDTLFTTVDDDWIQKVVERYRLDKTNNV